MPTNLGQIRRNLAGLDERELLVRSIKKYEPLILKLNQDQLNSGKTTKGDSITPEYASDYYARRKNRLNAKPGFGVPDLNFRGLFQADMRLVIKGQNWTVTSGVDYAKFILARYDDIMELSKEHLMQVRELVTAEYVRLWQKAVGL